MAFEAEIPLIVGLVGVAVAILERGYKRFLEERKEKPDLKFGGVYMLNLLVSAGAGTIIVTAIIPALIGAISEQVGTYTGVAAIFINLGLGYGLTYRFLDGLNTSTDKKMELAEAAKTETTTPTPTPPPSS